MLPTRIAAIGASSLFGRVDPQGGGYIGRLKTWHEQQALHNAVFNLGIGGETTVDMVLRFRNEIRLRKPNLIILSTGSNDTTHTGELSNPSNIPLETSLQNVRTMIEIGKKFADVVVVSITPIDDTKTQPLSGTDFYYLLPDATAYANATKNICEQSTIPYLNIFDDWSQQEFKPFLYEDGLHPNEQGHQYIFQQLKDFLEKLYK